VDHAECGVDSAVVIAAAKLVWVEKESCVGLIHDAPCHDLLQEFPAAFEEGDRAICLRGGIIGAGGFGKDDYLSRFPGMGASDEAAVEEGDKYFRAMPRMPI
jgi:hypothetical protein